ncbi:MAG: MBL fold metallo-hydrolase [Patescibacteria group bacterium]
MKVTFLGTGANGGIPQVDCNCKNCNNALTNKKAARLRSSLLIETDHSKIILDCGPDFRQQLLNSNLKLQDINLIAITHLHFDHSGGLMELSAGTPLNVPVLMSSENQKLIKEREDLNFLIKGRFMHFVKKSELNGIDITLLQVPHRSNSFPTDAIIVRDKKNSLWYSPDIAKITAQAKKIMKKCNLIVFDSTFLNNDFYTAGKFGHTTIENAAPLLFEIGVKTIFSHINHSENPVRIKNFIKQFNHTIAEDQQKITL